MITVKDFVEVCHNKVHITVDDGLHLLHVDETPKEILEDPEIEDLIIQEISCSSFIEKNFKHEFYYLDVEFRHNL